MICSCKLGRALLCVLMLGCAEEDTPLPCSTTWEYENGGLTCTMAYERGLPTRTECVQVWNETQMARTTTERTYAADALTEITVAYESTVGETASTTWVFQETDVTRTFHYESTFDTVSDDRTARYERDGLVFWGHPLDPELGLEAGDALLELHAFTVPGDGAPTLSYDITYTFDGPPRQGTRVRTASDGSQASYRYDDQGRLSEATEALLDLTHEYVDDRMTSTHRLHADTAEDLAYRYEDGLLVERTRSSPDWSPPDLTFTSTYRYDCP